MRRARGAAACPFPATVSGWALARRACVRIAPGVVSDAGRAGGTGGVGVGGVGGFCDARCSRSGVGLSLGAGCVCLRCGGGGCWVV